MKARTDELNQAIVLMITTQTAQVLLSQFEIGFEVAAALIIIAAGGNPDRLASQASFAALCGVSPTGVVRKDPSVPPEPRRPPASRLRHQPIPANLTAETTPLSASSSVTSIRSPARFTVGAGQESEFVDSMHIARTRSHPARPPRGSTSCIDRPVWDIYPTWPVGMSGVMRPAVRQATWHRFGGRGDPTPRQEGPKYEQVRSLQR